MYRAIIKRAWYDIHGRKYVNMEFEGTTKQVKVPFRYNRVMCRVSGFTPIQDMPEGLEVDCDIEIKHWDGESYWVLRAIETRTKARSENDSTV